MSEAVLLGAGALTFGLLCPTVAESGDRPLVFSRVTGSRQEGRLRKVQARGSVTLQVLDSDTKTEMSVELVDLHDATGLQRFKDLVVSPDVNLLITAAREGFDPVAELLVRLESSRAGPLVVVSADNSPPASWLDLAARYLANLDIADSVADRLCVRFPRTDPTVDVAVGDYARWIVQQDRHGVCVGALGRSQVVNIVEDVAPWRRRKLFCVNGLQLALAIRAFQDGYPQLDTWIRANTDHASRLAGSFARAYADAFGEDVAEIAPLCTTAIDRFASFPDRTGRMLGLREGQSKGDPADLAARVQDRLAPLRGSDKSGDIADAISHADAIGMGWQ